MNSKKIIVSKVYVDDIKNVTIEVFYKKFTKAVRDILLAQYSHLLSEDKCNRVANILAIKFCNKYYIPTLVSECNNINFMVSIANEYEYEVFNIQNEEYFLKLNKGKMSHRDIFTLQEFKEHK